VESFQNKGALLGTIEYIIFLQAVTDFR